LTQEARPQRGNILELLIPVPFTKNMMKQNITPMECPIEFLLHSDVFSHTHVQKPFPFRLFQKPIGQLIFMIIA
jgi:hypothetical protein